MDSNNSLNTVIHLIYGSDAKLVWFPLDTVDRMRISDDMILDRDPGAESSQVAVRRPKINSVFDERHNALLVYLTTNFNQL